MTTNTSQDYGQAMETRYMLDKIAEAELIASGNKTLLMPTGEHLEALLTLIKQLNDRIHELERESQFKGEGDLI